MTFSPHPSHDHNGLALILAILGTMFTGAHLIVAIVQLWVEHGGI
jgi:hypothetical protein